MNAIAEYLSLALITNRYFASMVRMGTSSIEGMIYADNVCLNCLIALQMRDAKFKFGIWFTK